MKYIDIIVSILSGLAVCIPLVVKLIQYVQKSIHSKNWGALIAALHSYTAQAEHMEANNAGKKAWVMAMVEETAKFIKFDYDEDAKEAISDLIDSACTMAKTVNTEVEAK